MKRLILTAGLLFFAVITFCQRSLSISGTVRIGDQPADHATVTLEPGGRQRITNENGYFRFSKLDAGNYALLISYVGFTTEKRVLQVSVENHVVDINLTLPDTASLENVTIEARRNESVSGRLKDISGTAIYAGKKTELINMRNINANLATNNTRQIYARIPGLNIWEYDHGGLQLGIGGRGLSPNRSSNFNIRQNGYDISADALGYPESYYTPSTVPPTLLNELKKPNDPTV